MLNFIYKGGVMAEISQTIDYTQALRIPGLGPARLVRVHEGEPYVFGSGSKLSATGEPDNFLFEGSSRDFQSTLPNPFSDPV